MTETTDEPQAGAWMLLGSMAALAGILMIFAGHAGDGAVIVFGGGALFGKFHG